MLGSWRYARIERAGGSHPLECTLDASALLGSLHSGLHLARPWCRHKKKAMRKGALLSPSIRKRARHCCMLPAETANPRDALVLGDRMRFRVHGAPRTDNTKLARPSRAVPPCQLRPMGILFENPIHSHASGRLCSLYREHMCGCRHASGLPENAYCTFTSRRRARDGLQKSNWLLVD